MFLVFCIDFAACSNLQHTFVIIHCYNITVLKKRGVPLFQRNNIINDVVPQKAFDGKKAKMSEEKPSVSDICVQRKYPCKASLLSRSWHPLVTKE